MNLLLLTQILTGLSAGFFLAWSVTVIPGTKVVSDRSYLEAMKCINKMIINPMFFIIFFVPMPLLIYNATSLEHLSILAALTYLIGPIGITMTKNIPLNNKLDAQDLTNFTQEEEKNFRKEYEPIWNKWHYIRTFVSVISFVLVLI
jgi:uncharacterized membrane protein